VILNSKEVAGVFIGLAMRAKKDATEKQCFQFKKSDNVPITAKFFS